MINEFVKMLSENENLGDFYDIETIIEMITVVRATYSDPEVLAKAQNLAEKYLWKVSAALFLKTSIKNVKAEELQNFPVRPKIYKKCMISLKLRPIFK